MSVVGIYRHFEEKSALSAIDRRVGNSHVEDVFARGAIDESDHLPSSASPHRLRVHT